MEYLRFYGSIAGISAILCLIQYFIAKYCKITFIVYLVPGLFILCGVGAVITGRLIDGQGLADIAIILMGVTATASGVISLLFTLIYRLASGKKRQ